MTRFISTLCILALSCLQLSCQLLEKPVTEQEARAFAKELEESIRNKNPQVFNTMIDPVSFKERMKENSGGKMDNRLLNDITENLKKRRMGNELVQMMDDNGTYQFVKQYTKNNTQHIIFRMFGSTGLNYHDLELVRRGEKIKVADMYVYVSGETLSKTVADVSGKMGVYYENSNPEGSQLSARINRIRKLIVKQQNAAALASFDSLPAKLKEEKSFQLMHISILSNLDEPAYRKAIARFAASFPNEPNLHLMMIDHYYLKEDFQSALTAVNKLDEIINRDPFLDFYRANIYNAMHDTAKAIEHYEKMKPGMPGFADGQIELIALCIQTDQTEKAKDLVSRYQADKQLDQTKLQLIRLLYPAFSFASQP